MTATTNTPARTRLPAAFAALEPWVADWSLMDEHGRFNKRLATPPRELDRFVNALLPRIDEIVAYLNTLPGADPDALTPPDRKLFDLALMWMEASIPHDLGWESTDIEDAWPANRLTFFGPSRLPTPANRMEEAE